MNIFIIGMPGSGKTTIAKHLAKALNYEFVDLDGLIEKEALMFIEEIFEKHGEKTFRQLETKALESINSDDTVISCGGGIVTVKENKAKMQGLKIYLDTDLDVIKERLENDYQRPLLKQTTLEQLFDKRYLKYQDFADIVINNNYDVEQTVKVILNYLKKEANK